MSKIEIQKIVEKMNLKNLTPDVGLADKYVEVPDINRPALQLTGFFDHFDAERVQIIGYVEYTFLEQMDEATKIKVYETLLAYKIPCIIFCRALKPDQELLEKAQELDVPIFSTEMKTSAFTAELIRWLNVQLAPCISIHGVLVDVYGVGVMIMGESGIGKSEAALELVRRGHRLVSDDVVEIRKVSDDTLVGTAPDVTKHFIELRGIGIVDVKMLYGVQSVRETQTGTGRRNTTGLVWRSSTQSSSATRLSAISFPSVPGVTSPSSWRRRPSTTDRRRWAITRRRSCTKGCRGTWQRNRK